MEDTGNHSDDDNDGLVSFLKSGCVDDVLNDDTDLVISEMSDQSNRLIYCPAMYHLYLTLP
jgi:hypothetical protein